MKKFSKIYKKERINILSYPFSKRIISVFNFINFFNLKLLLITLFGLIIVSIVFYIFQIASLISTKYQIQNYQKQINTILQKNAELEINLAKINSLNAIDEKIQEFGFEKANKVYYIQILEKSVAKKDIIKKEQ